MSRTPQFPRWQAGCTSADPIDAPLATAAVVDFPTDDNNPTDCEDSASRCIVETVLRVTASTESLANYSPADTHSSEDVRQARAADKHQRLADCGDAIVGMIEFQNNADSASASATSSPVVAPDASSDNMEFVINTPPTPPVASKVRQLVVKFDSDELPDLLDLPPLPEGNPRKIFRPGNTIGKMSKTNLGNPTGNRPRITHGDFSETSSRGNPVPSQGNSLRIFHRNPVRFSQNNVIKISMRDPTRIHKGNSSMGNPLAWNSPKLDVVDSTDNQKPDFPLRQWKFLANASNIAGSQATSDVVSISAVRKAKGKSSTDSSMADEAKGKVNKDNGRKKYLSSHSTTETNCSQLATVPGSHTDEADQVSANTSQCCIVTSLRLRILCLTVYYLVLWAVTAALTWGLLELSLLLTSKGKYPFYMSPHSYCMTSPAIGFAGCDPEPGKVTRFDNLTSIADKIDAALGSLAMTGRDCDAQNDAVAASLSEDALRIPCSMAKFSKAMGDKARQVLADRPALLIQIRRHYGYLPAKGPSVTVTCKSDLSLKYFSWNGSGIVESRTSGSVLTGYFPMLTQHHSVPSVLVSIDSATKGDWSGKEVSVKCTPSDGGSGQPAEKAIILVVQA